MTTLFCNIHNIFWDTDKWDYCLQCRTQLELNWPSGDGKVMEVDYFNESMGDVDEGKS